METDNNSSNSKLLLMRITTAMVITIEVSFLDQISQSLGSGLQEELGIEMVAMWRVLKNSNSA